MMRANPRTTTRDGYSYFICDTCKENRYQLNPPSGWIPSEARWQCIHCQAKDGAIDTPRYAVVASDLEWEVGLELICGTQWGMRTLRMEV